ncbi:MAG TPA: CsgG/HfaB family protein [Chthonomonas sp.]|uniref:CsgG/HfaB family protein n=1 Tax=Chthonomonas sp. TaxID=2282153 RepID=UPI002B4ACD8A|nr:CsgG/HfaB family protein [Chthonomonas sp.]HLI47686.1 CsgG/HfaB family protein [Chthonomonas sp.]
MNKKSTLLGLLLCLFLSCCWPCRAVQTPDDSGKPAGAQGQNDVDSNRESSAKKKQPKENRALMEALRKLPPYYGPRKRLGVMNMDVKVTATSYTSPTPSGGTVTTTTIQIPPPTDFGTGLTEMLTTALVESKRFVVLERSALQDIQAEQQLGASGGVNPTAAPKTGQLLGAQALIRGAVTEYSFEESSLGAGGVLGRALGLSTGHSTAMVGIDVRIYDVVTGEVIDSVHAVGRATASGTAISYNKGDVGLTMDAVSNTPLGEAVRRAIAQAVLFICNRMQAVPWEGRIADVEMGDNNTQDLYLNAGTDAGLQVGDKLDILHPGHAIVDPDTQTVIGRTKDVEAGQAHIVEVRDHISILAVDSGSGFQVGDVVHFISHADGSSEDSKTSQSK